MSESTPTPPPTSVSVAPGSPPSSSTSTTTTVNHSTSSGSSTPTSLGQLISNNTSTTNTDTIATATPATASASGQQFCLRWNNYQTNLLQVFDQLRESESFVDVTLSCEEKSVKAHRMVLSACSPYFQSVLKEADCAHPVIILQGVKWVELRAVVDFMYKGEINVSQEHLSGLLKVAESLKVRGLTDTGEGDETEAVITSPSPRNIRVGGFATEDNPRKRRRYSGDDALLNNNNNNHRSRSPSPTASPFMAMDFLEASLEPILSQSNMGRSSVSSHSSSSAGNGPLHNAASPTASLASSLTSLAAHMPGAMPPPGHPMGSIPHHLPHLPPISPLSPLLNMHHPMTRHAHNPEDFEIRPGIAEMIREEERVSLIFCSSFNCNFTENVLKLFKYTFFHLLFSETFREFQVYESVPLKYQT